MRVLVAGGHGNTGQRLLRRLPDHGHTAVGMVRDRRQVQAIEALGAEAVLADLESDPSNAVTGVDAVVFAAGAGAGSGAARKDTVDHMGCVRLAEACALRGVSRFVVLSSMGADRPDEAEGAMRPYMEAKGKADAYVRASSLHWTIVRPGGLTDDEARGRVAAAAGLGRSGRVSREDVAEVLAAVVAREALHSVQFELLGGDTPVPEALDAVAAAAR